MLATKERLYTIEEFEQIYLSPEDSNRLIELINGRIHEKMPTQQHGLVAANIGTELTLYARQYKTGRPGVEVRHQSPNDSYNSRLPDVSFTCTRSPLVEQGAMRHMPDLAVEIKSPNDTMTKMRESAAYYLNNGALLVWLVYPAQQMIEVYRPDEEMEILTATDRLTGGDVLPGFAVSVAEIFADPLGE